ncbi:hypothetical protein AX774_g4022 [Zancudomyces culisetae]|uniref:Uncharacterized protein n=1 Tax=Zancudomyces culisetae TaxID=1213189 RepID=A0A1R1PNF3_ZANCU|nr:hypothetical protein AX774_g4022 [Zancudomyces culisetae]|eukprot:OMH82495.1 hypothetical protein AX774_g4022 [Zancudomyces culisetae]
MKFDTIHHLSRPIPTNPKSFNFATSASLAPSNRANSTTFARIPALTSACCRSNSSYSVFIYSIASLVGNAKNNEPTFTVSFLYWLPPSSPLLCNLRTAACASRSLLSWIL